jgi:membrane-bound inhibitor of C-type lysozyme
MVVVLAVAAGCAAQPKNDPEIKDVSTVHYLCKDGTRLGVWFEPESAIITENDGETMILPQKRAGSGIWYGIDELDFRGKGEDATWTSGKRPPTQCHVTDPAPKT